MRENIFHFLFFTWLMDFWGYKTKKGRRKKPKNRKNNFSNPFMAKGNKSNKLYLISQPAKKLFCKFYMFFFLGGMGRRWWWNNPQRPNREMDFKVLVRWDIFGGITTRKMIQTMYYSHCTYYIKHDCWNVLCLCISFCRTRVKV